jgi:hypothetical protein
VRSGLEFLAAADAGSLPDAELADCLTGLELAAAAHTAARARILAAFSARGVFEGDGARSARSWLVWQTRTTKAAAGASLAWMRRLAAHPLLAQALAAAAVSESWVRQLCVWSDLLPPDVRDDADTIFLGAAAAGVDLAGLSALAEEMYARTAGPDSDDDDGFAERSLQLDLHWRGHGRLTGQLTPACAAALSAVLDSLGKKAGPEDMRTRVQRDHDALEEACRRLITSGIPDSAGQPAQILLHMTLSQLRDLVQADSGTGGNACDNSAPGATAVGGYVDSTTDPAVATGPTAMTDRAAMSDCLAAADCSAPAAAPHAATAPAAVTAPTAVTSRDYCDAGPWADDAWLAASGTTAGTAGWLSAAAAAAYACDAAITPVVSGAIDPDVLDQLSAALAGTRPAGCTCRGDPGAVSGLATREAGPPGDASNGQDTSHRQQIADLILAAATDLLSGPGGLTARLRTGLADARIGTPSLPLDIGRTDKIPAYLRRLVAVRHPRCAFPGCPQSSRRCQVHHLIPRSEGGPTALGNLVPLCAFHHLIAIHRWGWALGLNADGTTTATSPDRHKVLHSHGPPGTLAA